MTRNGSSQNWFGASVSLSPDGSGLAVGESVASRARGRVSVYRRGTYSYSWRLWGPRLLGSETGENCGQAVALSEITSEGGRLAYGCPGYKHPDSYATAPPVGRFFHYYITSYGSMIKTAEFTGAANYDGFLGHEISMSAGGYDLIVSGNRTNSDQLSVEPTSSDFTNGAVDFYSWSSP